MKTQVTKRQILEAAAWLLCFVLVLIWAGWASAAEVTLKWNANTESDLAGYRIFFRPPGGSYDYKKSVWQGTATTCKVSIEGDDGFFVARAYDVAGNESADSNEAVLNTAPSPVQDLMIEAIELAIRALETEGQAAALKSEALEKLRVALESQQKEVKRQ